MPSGKPERRFRDIAANIRSILDDVGDRGEAGFVADRIVHDAVLYRLLRISEAARKLAGIAEERAPGQPWAQIRAFGNAIRHDYDEIRLEQVWIIVQRDLPPLLEACERAIAALGAPEP